MVVEFLIGNCGWITHSDHFAKLLTMEKLEATYHKIDEGLSPAVVEKNRQCVAGIEAQACSYRSLRWPEPNFSHTVKCSSRTIFAAGNVFGVSEKKT